MDSVFGRVLAIRRIYGAVTGAQAIPSAELMFSESFPTNLRSSVTVINTLLNGSYGRTCNSYYYDTAAYHSRKHVRLYVFGIDGSRLVGAIVIMWLFVGETRGLDLKTVTGTEWDKPKKVKEEQQDGE